MEALEEEVSSTAGGGGGACTGRGAGVAGADGPMHMVVFLRLGQRVAALDLVEVHEVVDYLLLTNQDTERIRRDWGEGEFVKESLLEVVQKFLRNVGGTHIKILIRVLLRWVERIYEAARASLNWALAWRCAYRWV